jgi:hypothetical protein
MELAHQKPFKGFYQYRGLDHVQGFDQVKISVQPVGPLGVRLIHGAGNDQNGCGVQLGVPLYFRQDLPSIFFRKVQVEQDDIRVGPIGECPLVPEVGQGFLAVVYHPQTDGKTAPLEGLLDEEHIGQVVFREQDIHRPGRVFQDRIHFALLKNKIIPEKGEWERRQGYRRVFILLVSRGLSKWKKELLGMDDYTFKKGGSNRFSVKRKERDLILIASGIG